MFKKIIFIVSLLFSFPLFSQKKIETITIKTHTTCDHCKMCETCGGKMETDLYYVKGIKFVNYNENDMTITIKYKVKNITPDKIRLEISKLGYSADNIPPDMTAYEKLDACCKKK